MGYVIGSLNVNRFNGLGKHDTGKIADMFLSENFDIVALQEVMHPRALEMLQRRMPVYWQACYGDPRTDAYGFGFLWNTRRVRECSQDAQPSIFNQYRSPLKLNRDPFYGRFTPDGLLGGAFFEIRLIDVHLCWNAYGIENNVVKRKEEFRILSTEIYKFVSTHRYGNNMPGYTIVLGDYNLLAIFCRLAEQDTTYLMDTFQEEKTTISTKLDSYASDYDHFSYNAERFVGTDISVMRVNSVAKYMNNDFKLHNDNISNHVPIKLELNLNPRR